MFGKGYIVDCCISLFQKEQEEKALINYITTGIRFISENVAVVGKYYGADGRYLAMPYDDLFKPADNRTAEEIRDDVIEMCGLGG